MSLYIRQLEIGAMQNFVYLVGSKGGNTAWVVDPAWDGGSILAAAAGDGKKVTGILLTHAHYDHANAVEELLAENPIPVHVHRDEAAFARVAADTGLFSSLPEKHLVLLEHGQSLKLGSAALTVLHTPGHTPGSACFLVENNLFMGDTLFIGSCGRWDLPGGSFERLSHSLTRVLSPLPDDTELWPGHNYAAGLTHAALVDERRRNVYLSGRTKPPRSPRTIL